MILIMVDFSLSAMPKLSKVFTLSEPFLLYYQVLWILIVLACNTDWFNCHDSNDYKNVQKRQQGVEFNRCLLMN